MGLPLFITPVEPEVTSNSADKDAGHGRSAIRRPRNTRRPSDRIRAVLAEEREERTRQAQLRFQSVTDQDARLESHIREAAQVSLSDAAAQLASTYPYLRNYRQPERPELEQPQWLWSAGIRPRSPRLGATRPANTSQSVMPPAPEPNDFSSRSNSILETPEIRVGGFSPLRRWASSRRRQLAGTLQRQGAIPTGEPSQEFDHLVDAPETGLSSNFAPATLARSESIHGERAPEPAYATYDGMRLPVIDGIEPNLADLARVARQERSRTRQRTAVDGLGDRRRSLSPEGETAWDTILSTITPDPNPPSMGSSFASASASASASTNEAGRQSNPLSSITDDSTYENACDPVEDGEDEDTDSDSLDWPAEAMSRPRISPLAREPIGAGHDAIVARERFWRSYTDDVTGRAELVARHSRSLGTEMGGMQRILRTLADREEIPEEWWAQAGLRRTMGSESDLARGGSTALFGGSHGFGPLY